MFKGKMIKTLAISMVAAMALSTSVFAANNYESVKGTPTVDGELDEAYKASSKIDLNVVQKDSADAEAKAKATGAAYTLWDDSNLYVYVEVKDPNISAYDGNGSDSWQLDSFDLFVCPTGNFTDASLDADWARNSDDQSARFMASENLVLEPTAGIKPEKAAYKKIDGGYAYEIVIENADGFKTGAALGIEVGINDTEGNGRTRVAVVASNENGNALWHKESLWNTLTLKDAPAPAAETTTDTTTTDTTKTETTKTETSNPKTGDVSMLAYAAMAGLSVVTMAARKRSK